MAADRTEPWKIAYRPGGWVRLDGRSGLPSGFRGQVFLQLKRSDVGGRLLVHGAVMSAEQPVTARTWRQIPLSEIEAAAQIPYNEEVLTKDGPEDLDVVSDLEHYFDDTASEYGVFSDFLSEDMAAALSDLDNVFFTDPEAPIEAPRGRLTDDFLNRVAISYLYAASEGKRPAPAIAELANVPVRTVHGWITQARKRGILPPGRPGRAG